MRNSSQGNTTRPSNPTDRSDPSHRSNAFSAAFLQLDRERDEPPRGDDPRGEGPWIVLPAPARDWPAEWPEPHGVWALGERPERGDAPSFVGSQRAPALYSAIVRPIVGRETFYELGKDRWSGGFPLLRAGKPEAWMALFHPELAVAVSLLERMGRSPSDVALFLEAIGPSARERAGAILLERLYPDRG